VRIAETRPLSKDKRWRVLEIVRHDEASVVTQAIRQQQPTLQELAAENEPDGGEA